MTKQIFSTQNLKVDNMSDFGLLTGQLAPDVVFNIPDTNKDPALFFFLSQNR